jgi:hypothetical protein
VGNGQYYDPETGRFLNRNAKPEQNNPYIPWGGNPSSALIAPLALLVLVFGRKKTKNKLLDSCGHWSRLFPKPPKLA